MSPPTQSGSILVRERLKFMLKIDIATFKHWMLAFSVVKLVLCTKGGLKLLLVVYE